MVRGMWAAEDVRAGWPSICSLLLCRRSREGAMIVGMWKTVADRLSDAVQAGPG